MEGIVGTEVQRVLVDSTCCVRTTPAPRIELAAGPGAERLPSRTSTHATPTTTCASTSNGRYNLMDQARYVDPKARFGYPFSHSRRYFYLRGTRQHLQCGTHDRRGRRGWGQTPSQSVDSGIRERVDYHGGWLCAARMGIRRKFSSKG